MEESILQVSRQPDSGRSAEAEFSNDMVAGSKHFADANGMAGKGGIDQVQIVLAEHFHFIADGGILAHAAVVSADQPPKNPCKSPTRGERVLRVRCRGSRSRRLR